MCSLKTSSQVSPKACGPVLVKTDLQGDPVLVKTGTSEEIIRKFI
jgi:hypothetical protein